MIELEVGKWYETVGLGRAKITGQHGSYFYGRAGRHAYCWWVDGSVIRGQFSLLGAIAAPSTKPWWRFWE